MADPRRMTNREYRAARMRRLLRQLGRIGIYDRATHGLYARGRQLIANGRTGRALRASANSSCTFSLAG
jgi:hypothetical protein